MSVDGSGVSADTPSAPAGSGASTVDHADTGRGRLFVGLLRSPRTLFFGGGAIVMAGVIGAATLSPGAGAGFAGAVALLVLTLLAIVADSRAEETFFTAYASERSLTHTNQSVDLPPATALLRAGDARYSSRSLAGRLPGGVEGILSLFTVEVESQSEDRQVVEWPYTLVLTEVPGSAELLGEFSCFRRSGPRALDSADDLLHDMQRVEVESEALDRRCEIFIGAGDDMNRARQLLSPTFVDWLATVEQELAFTLEGGMLAVYVKGHADSAAVLDELCENAARIAERIRSEAAEPAHEHAAAPAAFDPGSLFEPSTGNVASEQLVSRMFAVTMVVVVVVSFGVAAIAGDGDGGTSDSGPTAEGEAARLAGIERTLLRVLAKRGAAGATLDEVEEAASGLAPVTIEEWFPGALERGLVESLAGGRYALTPAGEAARRSLVAGP